MARVRDLHNQVRDLNLHFDMNEDRTFHTVGQYILIQREGGYQVGQIWSDVGQYDFVFNGEFVPRKQLWNCMDAYMRGLGVYK
jgi:hypothetical protein|tara:strand:+ start:419 stop:667 length:249 start_codon:yes stop_codon:yes gene_type:complete